MAFSWFPTVYIHSYWTLGIWFFWKCFSYHDGSPTLGQILFWIALCNWEGEWNLVHDINQVVQNVTSILSSDSDFDCSHQACPHRYIAYLKEQERKYFSWCSELNYSEDKIHCEDVEKNIQELIGEAGVGKVFFTASSLRSDPDWSY